MKSELILYLDSDHVSDWSKSGTTTNENCQMLYKTHNREKGKDNMLKQKSQL